MAKNKQATEFEMQNTVIGTFDPANPWPEGSVVVMTDGSMVKLVELDLEHGCLTILYPDDERRTYRFEQWNQVYASYVEEVRYPEVEAELALRPLEWHEGEDAPDRYEAASQIHDDGSPFYWRVRSHGRRWTIAASSPELVSGADRVSFATLEEAQAECWKLEQQARQSCATDLTQSERGQDPEAYEEPGSENAESETAPASAPPAGPCEPGGHAYGGDGTAPAAAGTSGPDARNGEQAPPGSPRENAAPDAGAARSETRNPQSEISPPHPLPRPERVKLPVELVDADPDQPRKTFDEGAMFDLGQTLAQDGMVEIPKVEEMPGGRFRLIDGERRWRAARAEGIKLLDFDLYRNLATRDRLKLQLLAVHHRVGLNPVEQGLAYERYARECGGLSAKAVAEDLKLGKGGEDLVQKRLKILVHSAAVRQFIIDGRLKLHQAEALAKDGLNTQERDELAAKCVEERWSEHQLNEGIKAMLAPETPLLDALTPAEAPAPPAQPAQKAAAEERILDFTQVQESLRWEASSIHGAGWKYVVTRVGAKYFIEESLAILMPKGYKTESFTSAEAAQARCVEVEVKHRAAYFKAHPEKAPAPKPQPPAAEAPAKTGESWRAEKLADLATHKGRLPSRLIDILAAQVPPIRTLGELEDWRAKHGQFWAADIKGFGEKAQQQVDDLMVEFYAARADEGKLKPQAEPQPATAGTDAHDQPNRRRMARAQEAARTAPRSRTAADRHARAKADSDKASEIIKRGCKCALGVGSMALDMRADGVLNAKGSISISLSGAGLRRRTLMLAAEEITIRLHAKALAELRKAIK
jgi:ParB family chromosome partitioning protein